MKKLFKNIKMLDNMTHLVHKKEFEYIKKIIKPGDKY